VYDSAKTAATGKGKTMEQKRTNALGHFQTLGVTQQEVFAALDVKGLDDIGDDELLILVGFANAIKEGEQTVESIFRSEVEAKPSSSLNEAITPAPAKAGTKKAKKEDATAEARPCGICGRADGTHDPEMACYSDPD
jgi:hypothetical protein